VINKISFLLAVSILGATGTAAFAKNRNTDANPPSDPVMQSLTQGVDHLDGARAGSRCRTETDAIGWKAGM